MGTDDESQLAGERREGNAAREATTAQEGDGRAGDRWENEVGHAKPGSRGAVGSKQALVEPFAVGGYDYSKLAHAITEAKRARRQGDQL